MEISDLLLDAIWTSLARENAMLLSITQSSNQAVIDCLMC